MKKIISILLVFIATLTMIGCSSDNNDNNSGGNNSASKSISADGVLNFLDFEEYNPDFQLIRGTVGFGKVSQNSDMQYVKSGKYSAKVQPLGYKGAAALFTYPLVSKLNNFDYSDLSKLDMISLFVYNAESVNKNFVIAFGDNYSSFGEHEFILKPGWNPLAYFPNIDALSIACDIKNVSNIMFKFDCSDAFYLEDAPTYYFDDIKFTYDKNKEINSMMEYDEGEIIGFEKDYQKYAFTVRGTNTAVIPDTKIVTAADEGIVATQGEKVLKVTYYPDPVVAGTVAVLVIPEKVIRSSGIKDIPKDEMTSYAIKFDSYAATTTITSANVVTYGPGNTSEKWYRASEYDLNFVKGQWRTHTIGLFRSENGAFEIVVYLWMEGTHPDTERVVYFDNFRIEKIA